MKKLLVSLIVLMFAAAPASANLVVDGGFEGLAGAGEWTEVAKDGETFGAWTAHTSFGRGIWLLRRSGSLPPEGVISCHIGDSVGAASISQMVSGFEVGATYEVSIAAVAYTGIVGHPGGTLKVTNLATGVPDLAEVTFPAPQELGLVPFEYSSFEFTASNTELELEIFNPQDSATNVDDISIVMLTPCGPKVGTSTPLSAPMNVYEADPAGTAVQFSVVLDQQPGADVNVDVTPPEGDLTLNALGPNTPVNLTFTPANWNVAQTVTVKAFDDAIVEGTEIASVTMFGASSTDPNFNCGYIPPVPVTILDDDGKQVYLLGTPSVAEGGGTDTYTVGLQQPPDANVLVNIGLPGPNDPNVAEPLCQVTVNGGTTAQLTFTPANWATGQTITVAAVDDTMFEADPHSANIGHTTESTDPCYHHQLVPDMVVSITENDARIWSFGDDVSLSMPPNSSFEVPILSEGQWYVPSGPNGPFGPLGPGDVMDGSLAIEHISDSSWAVMYEVGQTVPDGENVLDMPLVGGAVQGTGYASRACEYLIEPGPVSYTFTVAVGLPKLPDPNDPDTYAELALYAESRQSPSGVRLASTGDVIAQGLIPAGEWKDISVCAVIPAGSPVTGKPIYMGVRGENVDIDNWRLTMGNHPCDGCLGDITEAEGDLDDDCDVDLVDFAILAGRFLDCLLYPECLTDWPGP